MKNKIKQIAFTFLSIFLLYAFFAIRVSKSLNKDDNEIINLLKVDTDCSNLISYDDEINCITSIQESQLSLIKGVKCRGKYINLGSKKVIQENTACCFDRSRITEQALQYYGFKVRHVFLNQTSSLTNYMSLLIPGSPSHAVTEVFTSKGWMGVDSNEPFILIDNTNQPYTYSEAISNGLIKELTNNEFYQRPIINIIGMYSRNGTFFKPYLPNIPEVNIFDFLSNINKLVISFPK